MPLRQFKSLDICTGIQDKKMAVCNCTILMQATYFITDISLFYSRWRGLCVFLWHHRPISVVMILLRLSDQSYDIYSSCDWLKNNLAASLSSHEQRWSISNHILLWDWFLLVIQPSHLKVWEMYLRTLLYNLVCYQ